MKKRIFLCLIASTLIIVIAGTFVYFKIGRQAAIENQVKPFEADKYYDVLRVIDGDTFVAKIGDNEEKIRLIGIDSPESVDPRKPVECFGIEASDEARKVLDGKKIRFQTDSSQSLYDKYGRLLAYVWTEDGIFFNLHMLENGFAYEYTYLGVPYKYKSEFKEVKDKAKVSGLGLWAKDACKK